MKNCLLWTCVGFVCSPVFAANPLKNDRQLALQVARLVSAGGSELLQVPTDSSVPPRVVAWMKQHRAALADAQRSPFPQAVKGMVVTAGEQTLYFHLAQWPKDGKLLVPRIHNSVERVWLLGREGELKLKPNVHDWEITLPERPRARDVLVPVVALKLDAQVQAATDTPPVVEPGKDGSLLLHSRYAVVHGKMLRFEPQPHKNTVGYWVEADDWAEWACRAKQAGEYEVVLRYGCGNGQGGSDLELTIGSHVLPFKVEATGGFQAWKNVVVGRVTLPAGKGIKVTARPRRKAKNAVMDIQQITLRRVP